MVVAVVSLATIPLGILVSVLRERTMRRRTRFGSRFAVLVTCMLLPWVFALLGTGGEQGAVTLLWAGFFWVLLAVALAPLLLFRGPEGDPGPSDDGGPGPGPDDDQRPPQRPLSGIPLPASEQSAARVRDPHRRPAARPRRPAREPERRP